MSAAIAIVVGVVLFCAISPAMAQPAGTFQPVAPEALAGGGDAGQPVDGAPDANTATSSGAAEALAARALELAGPAATTDDLRAARALLDRIVAEHPASDLAVAVILQADPGGVDVAELDRRIAGASGADAAVAGRGGAGLDPADCVTRSFSARLSAPLALAAAVDDIGRVRGLPTPANDATLDADGRAGLLSAVAALDACAPFPEPFRGRTVQATFAIDGSVALAVMVAPGVEAAAAPMDQTVDVGSMPSQSPALPAGTPETEAAMRLDRQAIRDLQARLLVSGYNPNGVDGQIGRGTRAAIGAWQSAQGIAATGHLGPEQLARLKQASQPALDAWLLSTANAQLYEPPPAPALLTLTPRRLAGTWDTITQCGPRSKLGRTTIRSAMNVVHAGGGTFRGRITNSQGLRGDVVLTLRGRTLEGTANYGLLIGRTSFRGRFADQSLTVSGSDTNRCNFSARKR